MTETIDNASSAPLLVIRRATHEDVPWLLQELRAFAGWNGLRLFGDEAHAEALVGQLIETQFVAIATRGDNRLGLIAGVINPHPFNPDLDMATELWWWVTPDARGSSAGARLLDAFDQWADESGADLVSFTLESESPVNPRTLERRGYRLAEYQFVREVS